METKANMQTAKCVTLGQHITTTQQRIVTHQDDLRDLERRIREEDRNIEGINNQIARTGDSEGFSSQLRAAQHQRGRSEDEKNRKLAKIRDLETDLRGLVNEFNSLRCGHEREA